MINHYNSYNYIINPKTNRKVKINGKIGKSILKKYILFSLQKGGKSIQNNGLKQEDLVTIYGSFLAPDKTEIDLDKINNNSNVNATYGTITPNGINTLIQHLHINSKDVFLDLGAGIGNVVVQFALNTPIKKAIGIEYVGSRYQQALQYLIKAKNIYGNKLKNKTIDFINTDIYKLNSIGDATIVFTCSTCFPDNLMDKIVDLCSNSPNLKYFISQKQLSDTGAVSCPHNEGCSGNLKYIGSLIVECSWNKECEHHIYTNIGAKLK